ncbi:MAG: histidine--tRNA ligase family protein [Bifidobacteriaceae bacterium]|jgi:histidyl-tRNA synthetase|nr:histidine--tRNA ligase family protein [Bifidobacteriaceae bacterium]
MKISGFAHFAPYITILENKVCQIINQVFELHGFEKFNLNCGLSISSLLAKGQTAQEIYLLTRLQGIENNLAKIDLNNPKQLGLRYDQTIPLKTYIEQYSRELIYPCRISQIGKVWRGERAQTGRFREFTQADIDIISPESITSNMINECILVFAKIFQHLTKLGLPDVVIYINSRKILQSFCQKHSIKQIEKFLRIIDKYDKIGSEGITQELLELNISSDKVASILEFINYRSIANFPFEEYLTDSGIKEVDKLQNLVNNLKDKKIENVKINFAIARGLDYYTDFVMETFVEGYENVGSVASGGQYNNLVKLKKNEFTGVGGSIGITRLMAIFSTILDNEKAKNNQTENKKTANKITNIDALVILDSNDQQSYNKSWELAEKLRNTGKKTIISPEAWKYGKQIDYANKLGIEYVWFPNKVDSKTNAKIKASVKNIITGKQEDVLI